MIQTLIQQVVRHFLQYFNFNLENFFEDRKIDENLVNAISKAGFELLENFGTQKNLLDLKMQIFELLKQTMARYGEQLKYM